MPRERPKKKQQKQQQQKDKRQKKKKNEIKASCKPKTVLPTGIIVLLAHVYLCGMTAEHSVVRSRWVPRSVGRWKVG